MILQGIYDYCNYINTNNNSIKPKHKKNQIVVIKKLWTQNKSIVKYKNAYVGVCDAMCV